MIQIKTADQNSIREFPMTGMLRPFLGACADAFMAVDAVGRIIDVNHLYCKLSGYSREELLEMSLAGIELGSTIGEIRRRLEQIAARGSDVFRTRHIRKDGSTAEVEVRVTAAEESDGEWYYLLFVRDVAKGSQLEDNSATEAELVEIFVQSTSRREFLDGVTELLSRWSGCRCIGIRVLDWLGNIPYESFRGFDKHFWDLENQLSVNTDQCICPRMISQSPSKLELPAISPGGSFVCNNTLKFADSLSPSQKKNYRGNCWKSGLASLAIIPLILRGEVLGAIQLADEKPDMLTSEKVEFIESLIPLIHVAVNHFNTEEELQQSYDSQIITSLLARLSLEDLSPVDYVDRALDIILSIPWLAHQDEAAGCIFLVDESEPGFLLMKAERGLVEASRKACKKLAFGQCLCGKAAEDRKIIFTSHAGGEHGLRCHDDSLHGHYCVPILTTREQTLGVINLRIREGHRRSEREDQSLTAIANTLAIGLQRKRAEERLWRRTAQAEALVRAASRLNSQLDVGAVLQSVCEETAKALGVSAVGVSLFNPKTNQIQSAASIGLPEDFAEPELLPFADIKESFDREGNLIVAPDSSTCLLAALRRGSQLIGSLSIYRIGKKRRFFDEELDLLQGLADQSAMAINNARLFSEAKSRLDHIVSLRVIDTAIAASLDLGVILTVFMDQVVHQLGVDAVDLLLLNEHTQMLEYAGGRGFHSDALKHISLRLGEGYAGQVALRRHMVSINDMNAEAGEFDSIPNLEQEDFAAYHGAPLVAKGRVMGVLEVFHRRPFDPEPEWLEFLEVFAGQAAIAIDNATLFEKLQQSNLELALAYDATLEGWSRALDLRDKETEGHTQRVTELTLRLARKLGVPDADMAHIRRGALLHDIGKMGIPDGILLKPGPLSDEEWEIMRLHPVYAMQMLSPITYLRQALDIPYCHHEQWLGGGYPRGLREEQIPLTARIFAVVDVWDALASDRPYRAAWSESKITAYIREQSGKHFTLTSPLFFCR